LSEGGSQIRFKKSSKLTHEEIAKLIGTSRSRINRIANKGENNVSIELLLKLIAVLEGTTVRIK
jgi:transcriptional regulator with XRE-family HTH domain